MLEKAWCTAGICFIRCSCDKEKMLVTHLVPETGNAASRCCAEGNSYQ